MLIAVENEPIVRSESRGTWEYCRDTKTGWRGYLHKNCDALTDNDGLCVMCGAPAPHMWSMMKHTKDGWK